MKVINPQFIQGLANDFSDVAEVRDVLVRLIVAGLARIYVNRATKEIALRGEGVVDRNALHLKVERGADAQVTIVFDPPAGWEQVAFERIREFTQGLYPDSGQGPLSWYKFAEWLWINLVAGALGDLEDELGEDALVKMSRKKFNRALLARVINHENSEYYTGELVLRRSEAVAALFTEAIEASVVELWKIEKLLGFRNLPPTENCGSSGGVLVTVDFGRMLRAVSSKPEDLYRLTPRRFEELVAHMFEKFGYEVSLTPQSRDGGYDVSAVRKAETETRVLIECKRYTPPNKVGRPTVQRLMGVLGDRSVQATMGIVATTSSFTRDAEGFIDDNRWKLQGRDFAGIVAWMKDVLNKDK